MREGRTDDNEQASAMGKISDGFWNAAAYRRVLSRWALLSREARTAKLSQLRVQNTRARQLRTHLDSLIHVAEERLALPVVGSNSFPKPHNADWSWRPEIWRGPLPKRGISSVESKSKLGNEITLFHDCTRSELTLRQLRNQRKEDLAPYGMRMDVFKFDGSFLSLVLDLPDTAIKDIKRTHVFEVNAIVNMEKPIEIFVRLNIQHGPNTEQMVAEFPLGEHEVQTAFDLAYSKINEKQVTKAWIDLIFEGPEMNEVTLRDLTFNRHPRAQV